LRAGTKVEETDSSRPEAAPRFRFEVLARSGAARRCRLSLPRGAVETPQFMPVGTRAAVNLVAPWELREAGATIVLSNALHLLLRPGPEVLRSFGGAHRFMAWDGPLLTDSGGFQILSLASATRASARRAAGSGVSPRIDEEGAHFKSYVDGRAVHLTPEASIAMQEAIGSDVMMVLDHLVPSTARPEEIREALDRTHRWALRSLRARRFPERQALFAIVQGGLSADLRRESAAGLVPHPFDGFAIGGLAVGDTRAERSEVIALHAELLPAGRPRYLMGVGTPADLLEAIGCGVDLFDCVLPTTFAAQSTAFTWGGRVRLSRREHERSQAPLDSECPGRCCRSYSRGYLHHLFQCREPLGTRLVALHNETHYLELMARARAAIEEDRYAAFAREALERLDRHEHGDGTQPGLKRRAVPQPGRHEIVLLPSGAKAVRDRELWEVMHPVVGPLVEPDALYAGESRLRERLCDRPAEGAGAEPVVLYDVGLGAASNALAAWRLRESLGEGARPLWIISFERDSGALELVLREADGAPFGLVGPAREAALAVLRSGEHLGERTRWTLVRGELPRSLARAPAPADAIFWDPWSPKKNPDLWSVQAFAAARARCGPRGRLVTYGAATSARAAMLLAGFAVGMGPRTGTPGQTTVAAVRLEELSAPLDRRWLLRLQRSSVPLPKDAPDDALARIAGLPQFAAGAPQGSGP
jgi:queuine tRNA-ribosyltransferase